MNHQPENTANLYGHREDSEETASSWFKKLHWQSLSIGAAGLIAALVVLLLLVICVFWAPAWIVSGPSDSDLSKLKPVDRIVALNNLAATRNSVRGTLVQAIAGALILLTAGLTWLQVRTARQGQRTDRFTKTIEQLGNSKTEVRIGGIYALEQISKLPDYSRQVAEIYAAYLRTHSSEASPTPPDASDTRPAAANALGENLGDVAQQARPDVQAVLRILITGGLWERAGAGVLDLSYVDMSRADLHEVNLEGVSLVRAKLLGADLSGANLKDADMREVDLRQARLDGADLSKTDLSGADLTEASLDRARMSNAQLRKARLRGASLAFAHLEVADLTEATLSYANLENAHISGAKLSDAHLTRASLRRTVAVGCDLSGVDLRDADLSGADLSDSNLDDADLRGVVVTPTTRVTSGQMSPVVAAQFNEALTRADPSDDRDEILETEPGGPEEYDQGSQSPTRKPPAAD